jgi:predicted pyridoxine 5'-phosphate oxidase superfamily flavin-nucleotide-binding protein
MTADKAQSTAAPVPGWDLDSSPFHSGELAVQERLGVRAAVDVQGRRAVRRYMPEQHQAFYAQLPYAFIGTADARGRPWASMLVGEPGFMAASDPFTLRVHARPLPGDPLAENLGEGAPIAVLGIELPTRRRNRLAGTVAAVAADRVSIQVRQTMGVCAKYIQARTWTFAADPLAPRRAPVRRADRLDARTRAIIARADTFFVASLDPRSTDTATGGADVSHRGGLPGFVRIDDDRTLTTPDFVGNSMFNTLGNFAIDPRAGLLFVDFETGDTVQIAARAEVIWDGPEVAAFTGAQRLVRYAIEAVIHVEGALPGRFSAPDYSPFLARTRPQSTASGARA